VKQTGRKEEYKYK